MATQVTVTVNHNDDELVLSLNDKPVAAVSIKGTNTLLVQNFLETLLEEVDGASFVSIEKIDEDTRTTVNEW